MCIRKFLWIRVADLDLKKVNLYSVIAGIWDKAGDGYGRKEKDKKN